MEANRFTAAVWIGAIGGLATILALVATPIATKALIGPSPDLEDPCAGYDRDVTEDD